MMIVIPKFLLFVMMTTAAAVAANSSKLAIEGEKSLSNNEEQATTTTTTTPEGFAASSLLSLSSPLSLVDANAVIVDRTSEHSDSGGRFSPNGINNLRVVVDPVGSSSKTGTMHNTVVDAVVSDILLKTLPVESGGHFSPSDINNNLHHAVVDPVTRGDGSSSKTSTMHHTVVDAEVSDVLLETDSGDRFFPTSIVNRYAVVDAINDNDEISTFTGTNSSIVSAQRKLVATAKKTTKHAKKNKPSDGTSDDGTNDGFAPATERPIKPLGLDLTCDPSQQKNLDMANGCQDNDCAHPVWADGCEGCMCFNYNNPTWCDGYRGDFYDTYFKDHGDNPFGDPNWRNRKCNPIFRPHSKYCSAHWQCEKGLYCQDSTSPGGGERGLCDICNDLISTVNCDEL